VETEASLTGGKDTALRINPRGEAEYRLRLSKNYLKRAEASFVSGDFATCVLFSQTAVKNAAKAIIAICKVPSWSHDPSAELRDLLRENREHIVKRDEKLAFNIESLAGISHELAPEHGRATYGEPERGLTPEELYDKDYASSVLKRAREAVKTASRALAVLL
jgi:HEPN domain-containing protein